MATTLVLLHGFTHTGASWDRVTAALPERYRALAPDLRGHGSAGNAVPVDLEAVLCDIAALAPRAFTMVGYSLGGRIALHVALAIPQRVVRLVLVGASPGISDPVERRSRRDADERLAQEIERGSIEQFASRWAQTPVLSDQPPAVGAAAHADRLRSTPAGLARALRGLGTGALPSLWERLGELAMPVTLVAGQRDAKFTDLSVRMSAAIAGAEVTIVPGAGHAVHLERPAQVAAIIAQTRPTGDRHECRE
jgi:2-succinyl-6-hydroxy-2,4-cyclohexadiene-1-carboxylate synthase